MEKDDASPAPVGVMEKPEKEKGSRKTKTESLIASNEPSQGSKAQTQTQTASTVPKPMATTKSGRKAAEEVKPEPKNSNDEGEEEHSS
ncbi:MAG: hypothetical protein EZS28_054649 [Streblomastix strix]|uniref:Uncharacterized protein n=1 Tax=Streblomastix strix TaxID=222440 RepID=A0A5J4QHJ3_9EUKA|nr:MAG: hypothetical protein EZS28_054649 [Streblomastix strix]